jgi:hypothetical protein
MPFTKENCPSPVKGNPEKAKEQGRLGGLAKAARSAEEKALDKVRKQAIQRYSEALEDMLAKCHKILKKVEKELLTPRIANVTQPDGTVKQEIMPLSEGKLELLLKYQKQLHEQVLGKPKQIVDGKIDVPITVVIQEEPEPIDITPSRIEREKLTSDVRILEENDPS